MSMDLNREQKRMLRKQGALNEQGQPIRAPRSTGRSPDTERVGLAQYLREVRAEMRKVAWPTWPEVRRYALVVFVVVVLFTVMVFGLDFVFGEMSTWLYSA
jgi:preprotein translocase subunit SecE